MNKCKDGDERGWRMGNANNNTNVYSTAETEQSKAMTR